LIGIGTTGGLHFYTDMIREKAMRGAWKVSYSETVSSFLAGMGKQIDLRGNVAISDGNG
jgi:hypothetical protein